MKKKLICLLMIFIVLFTSSCGSKSSTSSSGVSGAKTAAPEQKAMYNQSADYASGSSTVQYTEQSTSTQLDTTQKIIQNYEISIEVEDLKKAAGNIEIKVKEIGGYIENEEVTDTSSYAVARVPSDKLDGFINYLEKNYSIISKRKNSQNITDAYVDNDARLKNLKAEEAQMVEVLKKAGTVEDILKVQSELYTIRGNIEALESKKKLWDKQVDYSTININMSKKQLITSNRFISIISGNEFIKSIYSGFANSFLYLVLAIEKILIYIVSNIFVLVILAAAAIFAYKKYKKMKKNEEPPQK